MPLTLRPATPADLPFLVALQNTLSPDSPTTVDELRRQDAERRPDLVHARLIAEDGGQPVGQGLYSHMEWQFHPQHFFVTLQVQPQAQGQGVGRLLWNHLALDLRKLDAQQLFTFVRTDQLRAARFVSDRGFMEKSRVREAALLLAEARLDGLAAALRRTEAGGYRLMTFADYAAPDKEKQLYELDRDVSPDVPRPADEHLTFPVQDRYWEGIHANPQFDPSLWFVAVKDGQVLGMTYLQAHAAQQGQLDTGFTAVARAHRRQGLAQAMKLLALTAARQRGYGRVVTGNDATNAGMIAINTALGFVERPALLWMMRRGSLGA